MRFVALGLVLISLPIFIGLLRQYPHKRGLAFVVLGTLLFFGENLRISASVVGWPMWKGLAHGVDISCVDTLAIALIATRHGGIGRLPFWWLFAFLFLTVVLSIFESSVPVATLFVWWQWTRLIILFFAVGGECAKPSMRTAFLNGLSFGLMVQAAYVIPQKLSGVVQATGTMFHQNTLGMMTELALFPIIASVLSGDRGWIQRAGVLAGLIVLAGGGSRAAMGMSAVGIAILACLSLWREPKPFKFTMIGVGVLVIALTIPLGMLTLKERFGSNTFVTQERERAAFERAATSMAADHPIGVGANMYVPTANLKGYAARAGVAWNAANRSAPVHNAYLLARAEIGWLGQFAYMLLIFVPMLRGLRYAFKHRAGMAGDIVLGSSIALGILAVHNTYEFVGLTYPGASVTIAVIALIAGIVRSARPVRDARRKLQRLQPSYSAS